MLIHGGQLPELPLMKRGRVAVIPLDLLRNIYLSRWRPPKEQSTGGPPSLPTLKSTLSCPGAWSMPCSSYHMVKLLSREPRDLQSQVTTKPLQEKRASQHFILQLIPTLRVSIIIIITSLNTCVSQASIPLLLCCGLVFAQVVLDFLNCSIMTCISNISNTVAGADDIW